MSLPSGVALRDGAEKAEVDQPLPSGNGVHGGRFKPIGDVSATRKTTEQISLLKPGRQPLRHAPNSVVARKFLAQVEHQSNGGCAIWRGTLDPTGYGRFTYRGKYRLAHRVAWTIFRGPIPKGMEIDHTCFNRACVAPEHLEPVTGEENRRRALVAGRMRGPHPHTIGPVAYTDNDQPVTERQMEMLRIVARHISAAGVPPSIREIGNEMRIHSTNGVNDHLKALERKGLIVRGEMRARHLEITRRGLRLLGLQVVHDHCLTCGQHVPYEVHLARIEERGGALFFAPPTEARSGAPGLSATRSALLSATDTSETPSTIQQTPGSATPGVSTHGRRIASPANLNSEQSRAGGARHA